MQPRGTAILVIIKFLLHCVKNQLPIMAFLLERYIVWNRCTFEYLEKTPPLHEVFCPKDMQIGETSVDVSKLNVIKVFGTPQVAEETDINYLARSSSNTRTVNIQV